MECKGEIIRFEQRGKPGFNRDIVECKGHHRLRNVHRTCDLIETLWNVKDSCFRRSDNDVADLIETLWNVKLFDTGAAER